jgi:hypothetical protein
MWDNINVLLLSPIFALCSKVCAGDAVKLMTEITMPEIFI